MKPVKESELESTESRCESSKRSNTRNTEDKLEEFEFDNLERIGREQFFWHYPRSKLPIRNITEKTEPHIEIGAENYLRRCIQPNIRGFCHSRERYLFLCTTCKNREMAGGRFFGKRFVVGYIEKKSWKNMDGYLTVIGDVYIVPFNEKLEYGSLGFNRSRGMQRFNNKDTEKLLGLIESQENIRNECIEEMIRAEAKEREIGSYIPIEDECLGLKNRCFFKNDCLRRKSR